ncbi:MAG: NADH-quinone oxidoreductase subunit NuoB [Cyanobacteria bacterium SZAS-4]|nr:NADH-quinone oxidoreductase subunit NuoB [Cyanobacteria bacterium SZAS-4]
MLKLLAYLLKENVVTIKEIPPTLPAETRSLPKLTEKECAPQCETCRDLCPTNAISIYSDEGIKRNVDIDLSACINCSLCISQCPTGTIVRNDTVKTARSQLSELILSTATSSDLVTSIKVSETDNIFGRSIACRVVSTGCSACDLEISACTNPIFDMERFGISIVASPRFADVLLVTGPVPRSMHEALKSCYMAMSEPRKVVAVGTCACSGGVHRDGYTEANGVAAVLPVDLFIPGCPPHPWSIVEGLLRLMHGKSTDSR